MVLAYGLPLGADRAEPPKRAIAIRPHAGIVMRAQNTTTTGESRAFENSQISGTREDIRELRGPFNVVMSKLIR